MSFDYYQISLHFESIFLLFTSSGQSHQNVNDMDEVINVMFFRHISTFIFRPCVLIKGNE